MKSISEILRPLDNLREYVFSEPMSEDEVDALGNETGLSFPDFYRDYLLNVGLFQDWVRGLYMSRDHFVRQVTAYATSPYFPVGSESEEVYLLERDTATPVIFEHEHWRGPVIARRDFSFFDLIADSVSYVQDNAASLPVNAEKEWRVQFSVSCQNEAAILRVLTDFTVQVEGQWSFVERSVAKVSCYEVPLVIGGLRVVFKRQEYGGWPTPNFYFNMCEPLDVVMHNSLIKKIDKALRESDLDYNLVDYGILPMDSLSD